MKYLGDVDLVILSDKHIPHFEKSDNKSLLIRKFGYQWKEKFVEIVLRS